jgi:DnaJ-domain-containing protein 1
VDQIFDRFERLFKSWVSSDTAELFGSASSHAGRSSGGRSGDPDLDSAMDELNDFLDTGRTETEAREREKARREREESARRASNSKSNSSSSSGSSSYKTYSRPEGPPQVLLQAYRSLGLAYGTPFPEVKAAYKRLLMQNHPDRNSATPDQVKRSTEISVQLNAAYHRIETWNATGKMDDA